jgi:hypothetical protein
VARTRLTTAPMRPRLRWLALALLARAAHAGAQAPPRSTAPATLVAPQLVAPQLVPTDVTRALLLVLFTAGFVCALTAFERWWNRGEEPPWFRGVPARSAVVAGAALLGIVFVVSIESAYHFGIVVAARAARTTLVVRDGIAWGELAPPRMLLALALGVLAFAAVARFFTSAERAEWIYESHWGGFGGGSTGARVAPSIVYLATALVFAVLAVVVMVNGPTAAPARTDAPAAHVGSP